MSLDVVSYAMGRKSASGGVQPVLVEETLTITENGTTVLTPESGVNGFSKVTIAVGVAARCPHADVTGDFGYARMLADGFGWSGSATIE